MFYDCPKNTTVHESFVYKVIARQHKCNWMQVHSAIYVKRLNKNNCGSVRLIFTKFTPSPLCRAFHNVLRDYKHL
jgi:hypothetical protein